MRWPPHINLLYPFVEGRGEEALAVAAEGVRQALTRTQPFTVRDGLIKLRL